MKISSHRARPDSASLSSPLALVGACVVFACASAAPASAAPSEGTRHLQELSVPASADGLVLVGAPVGQLEVVGTDRQDVLAQLAVRCSDPAIAAEVTLSWTKGRLEVLGPSHGTWKADLRVEVPRDSDVEARAEWGGLTVENLVGRVDARVGVGALRLRDVSGDVTASTRHGAASLDYTKPAPPGTVSLTSESGEVRVVLSPTWHGSVDLSTRRGTLRNESPWETKATRKDDGDGLTARVGSGTGPRVVARAESGTARLLSR